MARAIAVDNPSRRSFVETWTDAAGDWRAAAAAAAIILYAHRGGRRRRRRHRFSSSDPSPWADAWGGDAANSTAATAGRRCVRTTIIAYAFRAVPAVVQ